MADFKDFFSKQSSTYVQYRPTYPKELFDWLSSLVKEHALAWDCGTGNGQTANTLTLYFNKVVATDPSEKQIQHAIRNGKVVYKIEKAEASSLPDASVDLITISQALHWFDLDAFYPEARRVMKPEGIIAAWIYKLPLINPEIEKLLYHFHDHVIGPFWQDENRMVEKGYTTLPFPFPPIESPPFQIHKEFSFDTFMGFMNSWSALQRYIDHHGHNPLEDLAPELLKLWGERDTLRIVSWNLVLKVGRNY